MYPKLGRAVCIFLGHRYGAWLERSESPDLRPPILDCNRAWFFVRQCTRCAKLQNGFCEDALTIEPLDS